MTYSLLISGSAKGASGATKVEGSAPDVTLRKGTRLHQIVQWLQNGDGDPLIVRPLWTLSQLILSPPSVHSAPGPTAAGRL